MNNELRVIPHIVTDLKLKNGTDCTSIIQAALIKKGWVRIVTPGTFLVGKLQIDSDTKFELMPGVTLKKKDGTNHCILVNKGHVTGIRNKNITIRGGIWDLNSTGNPNPYGDLSVDPQSWSGIGVTLRSIDNLVIEDIEQIGGEWKYCWLITDCNQTRIRNVNIINESDGLHFQPPMKNLFIENITGVTHDDLISFTMGDYPHYSLGQTGNIENVYVRNIYAGATTDEIIKLVGSGIDGNSVFKNMMFENLSGFSTIFAVCILKEDQATANPCLRNTKLENVVFENIDVKVSGSQSYFSIGAASGDVTIRKLRVSQVDSLRPISLKQCNLDKVVIEDLVMKESTGTENTSAIIRVDNTASEVLSQLIVKDSNISLNSSATIGYIIYSTSKSVKDIFISNIKCNAPAGTFLFFDGANTDGINVYLENSQINTNILCNATVKTNIMINNSIITSGLRTFHLNDGATIRLLTSNSGLSLVINGVTAQRVLSASGDFQSTFVLSNFTPQFGDRLIYNSAGDATNKGFYMYNGTAWVKIA